MRRNNIITQKFSYKNHNFILKYDESKQEPSVDLTCDGQKTSASELMKIIGIDSLKILPTLNFTKTPSLNDLKKIMGDLYTASTDDFSFESDNEKIKFMAAMKGSVQQIIQDNLQVYINSGKRLGIFSRAKERETVITDIRDLYNNSKVMNNASEEKNKTTILETLIRAQLNTERDHDANDWLPSRLIMQLKKCMNDLIDVGFFTRKEVDEKTYAIESHDYGRAKAIKEKIQTHLGAYDKKREAAMYTADQKRTFLKTSFELSLIGSSDVNTILLDLVKTERTVKHDHEQGFFGWMGLTKSRLDTELTDCMKELVKEKMVSQETLDELIKQVEQEREKSKNNKNGRRL